MPYLAGTYIITFRTQDGRMAPDRKQVLVTANVDQYLKRGWRDERIASDTTLRPVGIIRKLS